MWLLLPEGACVQPAAFADSFGPLLLPQDYSDYAGKFGAAGVGVLAAFLSVARGRRRLAWA